MSKRIDKDDLESMAKLANKTFGSEEVQITEEDFVDKFDKHLKAPKELPTNKEQMYDIGEHCNRYEPCPICNKCRVKGSHIYEKCDTCPIPICVHENKIIERLIVRDNFKQKLPDNVAQCIKEEADKVLAKTQQGSNQT